MIDYNAAVHDATEAANRAGDEWLKNAKPKYEVFSADLAGNKIGESSYMLDLCGNAHVQFKDKRNAHYKRMLALGLIRRTGNGCVDIRHRHKMRQEHGLALACAEAALGVLKNRGIDGLKIWEYID